MISQTLPASLAVDPNTVSLAKLTELASEQHQWFALFTAPQNELSVGRHLEAYHVESFVPTYETVHVWKNRQKKRITRPLFPSYVFVHVTPSERRLVFRAPGVLRLIGGTKGPISIPPREIDYLRSAGCRTLLEPFHDLVIGELVRIRRGPMQGVEGTLVRKKESLRFVLTIGLINQHASLEVSADDLECLPSTRSGLN